MESKNLWTFVGFAFFLSISLLPLTHAQCDPPCLNEGLCKPGNACQCINNGWTGIRCEIALCTNYSLGCRTGKCVAPNVCNCTGTGFNGSDCSIPICEDSCLNGGDCSAPNSCNCRGTGYTGARCEVPQCNAPIGCGPGTCIAPEVCKCNEGWNGTYCTIPICNNPCQHGGRCFGPDACDCEGTSYTGEVCETAVCSPPCENSGVCTSPNVCDCSIAVGWTGDRCQDGICSFECQNGGRCGAPDQCDCRGTGYAGEFCDVEVNECLNTDPVCDSLTSCVNTPGNYSCTQCPSGYGGSGELRKGGCVKCGPGYSGDGTFCNPICAVPVCVHGTCIAPNQCKCDQGWLGQDCSELDELTTATSQLDIKESEGYLTDIFVAYVMIVFAIWALAL